MRSWTFVALDVTGRWLYRPLESGGATFAIFLLLLELHSPPYETGESQTYSTTKGSKEYRWGEYETDSDWPMSLEKRQVEIISQQSVNTNCFPNK